MPIPDLTGLSKTELLDVIETASRRLDSMRADHADRRVVDMSSRVSTVPSTSENAESSSGPSAAVASAEKAIDQGPNFGTPGSPPTADPERLVEVEQGFDDRRAETRGNGDA